jgi:hypothetical protein
MPKSGPKLKQIADRRYNPLAYRIRTAIPATTISDQTAIALLQCARGEGIDNSDDGKTIKVGDWESRTPTGGIAQPSNERPTTIALLDLEISAAKISTTLDAWLDKVMSN